MTNEQQFVALKPFRFGAGVLQPGDPVPVEAGRDYRLMQRLGQIAPVSVTAPAAAQQEAPLLTPYEPGESVYFISEDGAATLVTFHEALEAPDEVREGLGLKEGDVVASVTFPDDGANATFVPLESLLPEQPTARLIEDMQEEIDARQFDVDALTRERDQARQELEPLRAAQQKAEGERDAAQAQVATLTSDLEAARVAPLIPADALKRITEVKGVGDKLAPVILAALTAPPEPPAEPGA